MACDHPDSGCAESARERDDAENAWAVRKCCSRCGHLFVERSVDANDWKPYRVDDRRGCPCESCKTKRETCTHVFTLVCLATLRELCGHCGVEGREITGPDRQAYLNMAGVTDGSMRPLGDGVFATVH